MFKGEKGGITLEYLVISAFALFSSIALLGLATTVFHDKISTVFSKLGVDSEITLPNPFTE